MKHLALTIGGETIEGPPGIPTGGIGDGTVNTILGNLMQLFFVIAVIVTLFMIIWAGFLWVTSQGDKEKVASARKRITYAIIGLVVIFFSVLMINLLLMFLSQPQLGSPLGGLELNPFN